MSHAGNTGGEDLEAVFRRETQRRAGVVVPCRDVGRTDRADERIVLRLLAQEVEARAGVAGVDPPGSQAAGQLQLLRELPAADPEVGLEQVVDRQAQVTGESLGNLLARGRLQSSALLQRRGIVAERELLDFPQERLELGRARAGQAVVVPRGGGHRRQRRDVGGVDARVEARAIYREIEVEDRRQQDHAVQVDAEAARQFVGQDRRTRGAITFAEQVLGRIPPAVLVQELLDEAGERMRVVVHSPERLFLVLAGDARKAGAGSIDEHQVRDVEQRVRVVDHRIRRGRRVTVLAHHDAARAEGAHVQPQRGRSRAAVVDEHQRPRRATALFASALLATALLEISGVENRGLRRHALLVLVRRRRGGLFAPGDVVPAGAVHHQGSRDRLVGHRLATDRDRTGAGHFGGLEDPVGTGGLDRIRGLGLIGGEAGPSQQRQCSGTQDCRECAPFEHGCSLRRNWWPPKCSVSRGLASAARRPSFSGS